MTHTFPRTMRVIDSHTEGEPTRVVIDGWPTLAGATMAERRAELIEKHDHLRNAVVCEPRGHDAIVGALLTPPVNPGSTAGVIFFNNVGCLGMCGHGLIGVVRTLQHLGGMAPGDVRVDTPAGTVSARLGSGGDVTIRNVPSHVHARDVTIEVDGIGKVTGDVAYGGNWFFITHLPTEPLALSQLGRLTDVTLRIRAALDAAEVTGESGEVIDHVELYEPLDDGVRGARNFVMCPGGAYDRSPCGTGTSAKLAALFARNELAIGEVWRQESVTGGVFTAWLEREQDQLIPHVRGRAFITSDATLRFDPADPFVGGFSSNH